MSTNVECKFFDYDLNKFKQYEFDINLNIYPCCYFYLNKFEADEGKIEPAISDTTIDHIDNSLKTNKLKNITDEFDKVLNPKIWNSIKCPKICIIKCGEK